MITPEEPTSGNQAELLAVRLMTGLIALVALVEVFVAVPPIVADARGAVSPQLVVGAFLGIGIPLLAGVVAIRGSLTWLKRMNGATALGHVALTLGWVFAFHDDGQALGVGILWILASGPSIAAATMAWGVGPALLVLLTTSVLVPVANFIQVNDANGTAAFIDGLSSLTFAVAFAGVIVTLLTAARTLDQHATLAESVARLSASSRAKARSEQETNTLVHDDILSTLMFASNNMSGLREVVARQASQAMAAIDQLTCQTEDELHPVKLAELVAATKALCQASVDSSGVVIDVAVEGRLPEPLPPMASHTLLSALGQALVNSVQHAGAGDVRRSIRITANETGIAIVLTDNGVGFNPEDVPSDRLGMRQSISGRMRNLQGGSSHIASRVGTGTAVTLSWSSANDAGEDSAVGRASQFNFRFKRYVTWVVACAFLACNALICIVQIPSSTNPIPSLVALGCIVACFGIFGLSNFRPPSVNHTIAIVLLTLVAASMQFFSTPDSLSPRLSSWYLSSLAAILLVLVFQHHSALAWAGMSAIVVIVFLATASLDSLAISHLDVVIRPVLILTFGSIFVLALNALHKRIVKLRATEQKQLAEEAFVHTARIERHKAALRLQRDAGPLLATLSLGAELSPHDVARCLALEGTLRDQSRGHRLTQTSLVDAARNARMRGIDVVLLDDAQGATLESSEISEINAWMAESLDGVRVGQFTGRILPAGRAELATIVIRSRETETNLAFSRSDTFASHTRPAS